jgi:alkylhydroperoxidase/carboxymuconolactone decarboxylase family protein YurZ
LLRDKKVVGVFVRFRAPLHANDISQDELLEIAKQVAIILQNPLKNNR